ncbi:MAG: hypothetical protein ACOCXI_14070 [Chloroflexota bacterium]
MSGKLGSSSSIGADEAASQESIGQRRRFAFLRAQSLWVAAIFLLLTTIAAWPILADLDGVLVGQDSDVFINPWADWWSAKALADPDLGLWHSDYLFYPNGADLHYHSFSHFNTAVSLLLQPLLGQLPAYNLAILLNYVLAGLAMFQFVRYLTDSSPAALLAALVFAFNSHNLYQSAHPVLLGVWPLPWAGLFLLRAVREKSYTWALTAALFVFLSAAVSMLMVLLMAWWLAFLLVYLLWRRELSLQSTRTILTFVLASVISCLPLVFPLLQEVVTNRDASFIIDRSQSILSLDVAGVLIPHWGVWYKRGIYFGIVPIFLLLVAVRRARTKGQQVLPWITLLFFTYLFAIGPDPTLAGSPLGISLPWTHLIVPLLRNPYRLNIILSLALSVLVALGWLEVSRTLPQGRAARYGATAFLGLLLLLEYLAPGMPYTPVRISSFYTDNLDTVPDDVALAIVPTGRDEGKHYLFDQTFHGHKITSGVISRPSADAFAFVEDNALLRAGASDLEPAPIPTDLGPSLRELARHNVGYLIIDKRFDLDVEAWRAALESPVVYEDDLLLVYGIEQ